MLGRRASSLGALMVVGALLAASQVSPPRQSPARLPALDRAAAPAGAEILGFGDATPPMGSVPAQGVAAMAMTPDGKGAWVVGSAGHVTALGDAGSFGAPVVSSTERIVGMAATPDGEGYWLAGSDGAVFAAGNAHFFGSAGAHPLNRPIVGMAATRDGRGYWLVASDGGIFTYGDAGFFGSAGGHPLNEPIVGMAATPDGQGYWLAASDGGIFTYGDAHFFGSAGAHPLNRPIVGMAATPDGHGYWLVASDGGIFTYGDARFFGSPVASLGGRAVAGIAASPTGQGYSLLVGPGVARVGFGGDVNGIGRVGAVLAAGGNPLAGMESLLATDDVNMINLETAVGSLGTPMDKQYTFHSPPALLSALKAAGIGVVNLANNHSLDFGSASLLETIDDAQAAGLMTVGAGANAAQAYAPAVVDTPGGTVAFLGLSQVVPAGWAATATGPGVASAYDVAASVAAIRAARAEADHVVVMLHWGVEGDVCPTAADESLAQTLLQAGADVIAGGHPHVLQGIVPSGPGLVDFSLGNFVWYADNAPGNLSGLLSVELGPGGVAGYDFHPARIDATGSPQPLAGSDATAASAYVASLAPGAGMCP